MKKLKFPKINVDFVPRRSKSMDEVVDSLMFSLRNNLIDKSAARLQKKWTRVDRPFRILTDKKAA